MIRVLFIPLCALVSSSALSAQSDVQNPGDPYVQAQTGMAWPARIAGAERHQVVRYNSDGSDTGVGYQIPRNGKLVAYVSMFVYPAPVAADRAARENACVGLFKGIKRDILGHKPTARLVRQDRIAAPSPMYRSNGFRVVYTGGLQRFDGREQSVREEGSLFCYAGGKWLVAYRITTPEGVDATPEVDRFVRALAWPVGLSDVR